MAEAVDQHIPAEWNLGDLLRHLASRYRWREDFALYAIEQRIATGDLPLKVRHYLDEKFQGESVVDPAYYRNYLGLEIKAGRVHVISKYFALVPGEFRYTVLERDAQFVDWSAQYSRKADDAATPTNEASKAAEARLKTATPIWAADRASRLKAAGKITDAIRRTDLAKMLATEMRTAAKTDESLRPVKWEHIKNQFPAWGLWPISKIK